MRLLRSDSEGVQRVAAGALRNAVYQSSENKMEVKEKGGLGAILQALRSSHDVETRRELTGRFSLMLDRPRDAVVSSPPFSRAFVEPVIT